MPTIPPEVPQRPAESHHYRQVAESFGGDAQRYDRARPGYPQALIDRAVAASPGRDVLDVGCGTGIAARQFQAAGCTVLGIDPDERMAAFALQTGVEVEVATFEAWDAAGRTFDAVVAAQAWHWVDPVAGAAKAATVLRPGGLIAMFWHAYQLPPDIGAAYGEAFHRVVPDSPFDLRQQRPATEVYQQICAKAADAIRAAGRFGEPEQWRFDWEQSYTRDALLDLLPTQGGLTRLSPDRLAVVLEAVGAAIDAAGGNVTMTYATVTVAATRDAAA
ncbi:MAG TPA: class I SAM-dependent methyltransferase [Streptosporangiaceae bacterium]|nr:class I SAM-dependent methyltransferase [Streptosporangiaceae bacterium]